MEEDYDYVELHVTNVRKVESDRRRCIVSMQPNNDVREFMFFTDEYNVRPGLHCALFRKNRR